MYMSDIIFPVDNYREIMRINAHFDTDDVSVEKKILSCRYVKVKISASEKSMRIRVWAR